MSCSRQYTTEKSLRLSTEKVIIDAGHGQFADGLFRLQQLIVGMPVEVAVKAEGYEPHTSRVS